MTEQDFESLLTRGYETNGVEFKSPGKRTDHAFLAGVIRAMLGMANRRDGGLLILGVKSDSGSLDPVGFDDDNEALAWLDYDELAAKVNEYASPSVRFDLESQAYQNRKFVVIRVTEFEDIPILCVKEYHHKPGKGPPILRRGACYVRARHKPETSEIPSAEEMRELLELAIDKGVRKFVTRAQKAGLFQPIPGTPVHSPDEPSFKKQIEEMG